MNRPLRWTGTAVEEGTDSEIDTEILDHCIEAMVEEDANTVGQYKIDTSSPSVELGHHDILSPKLKLMELM